MSSNLDPLLVAARAGDAKSFDTLVAPHRPALVAHCYRLLGSPADAEDVVQDALVRAWNGLSGFDGRASLRTWLYRVTTNVCLTELTRRPRRHTADELRPAAAADSPMGEVATEVAWLEPCPASFWQLPKGPEARYSAKESVMVAFLTLLQSLPPLQRAVLVFRDVMGWSADETADALSTTTGAVTSALQRARTTMDRWREGSQTTELHEAPLKTLLGRYVQAWETGDATALASLLQEDAKLTMPPLSMWVLGREAIGHFVAGLIQQFGPVRVLVTEACGGPAVGIYTRAPGADAFVAQSLQVLSVSPAGQFARLDTFMHVDDFARFGLPPSVS